MSTKCNTEARGRLERELLAGRVDDTGVQDDLAGQPELSKDQSLDCRLPGLFLDALAPMEAAIASAATGVPYIAIRNAVRVDEDGWREILLAAQAVVAKHPDFFDDYRSELEILIALMAISAAQVNQALILTAREQARAEQPLEPCSAAQAFTIGLILFAPLALLAIISVLRRNHK